MNKKMKIALILVAVILVALLGMSLAYSKYYTKIDTNAQAQVAKWSFKLSGETTNAGVIDLGKTKKKNSKVAENKVAPGTEGSFKVGLDATGSEVDVAYNVKLESTESQKPTNLKFYSDPQFENEIADITTKGMQGTIPVSEGNKVKDVTIYWKWAYETGEQPSITENDKIDTKEGENANSYTFKVMVTGTQVDGSNEK